MLTSIGRAKIVKVAGEDLIGVVETLARRIWRMHYTSIVGEEQVEYMLNKFQSKPEIIKQIKEGFHYYLIRSEENEDIGYFAIVPKEDELFLSKLYVTVENRRKGYGQSAMQFIEKTAKEKNLSKISLIVNKKNADSIQTYEKFGFAIISSIVQDIGGGFFLDDYRMEKAAAK